MKAQRERRDKAPSSLNLDISFTLTTGIQCKEAVRAPEPVWTFGEEKILCPWQESNYWSSNTKPSHYTNYAILTPSYQNGMTKLSLAWTVFLTWYSHWIWDFLYQFTFIRSVQDIITLCTLPGLWLCLFEYSFLGWIVLHLEITVMKMPCSYWDRQVIAKQLNVGLHL